MRTAFAARRHRRAHHRRLWFRAGADRGTALAADDAAAAFVVLHGAQHRGPRRATGHARRRPRPPLEDRARLIDLFPAWADARVQTCGSGARRPARRSGEPVRCHAHRASPGGRAMSERLSIAQIAILCGYAGGMAAGQILFKLASLRLAADGSLLDRATSLLQNWLFLAALA